MGICKVILVSLLLLHFAVWNFANSSCPSPCTCSTINEVDCGNKNLQEIPEPLPTESERLYLQRNKLTELANDQFVTVARLEALDLSYNAISDIKPGAFNGLTNLKFLLLPGNQLDAAPRKALKGLSNLQRLYLYDNKIQMVLDASFRNNDKLEQLLLSNNEIDYISPDAFDGMNSLQILHLYYNKLENVPWRSLRGLTSLVELNLHSNVILAVPANSFSDLRELQNLYLNSNKIVYISPLAFAGLENLKILGLDSNQLESVPCQAIQRLQQLDLSRNPIHVIETNTFLNLTKLKHLILNHMKLETVQEGAFSGLGLLEILEMRDNRLQTLPVNLFSALTSLQIIELWENRWRCDCNLRWLKEWSESEYHFFYNNMAFRVKCNTPEELSDKYFAELAPDDFICVRPWMYTQSFNITVDEWTNAVLPCNASGFPPPTGTWITSNNVRYRQDVVNPGDRVFVGKDNGLNITVARKFDSGSYTCNASNPVGSVNVTINLKVNEREREVTTPQISTTDTTTRREETTTDCDSTTRGKPMQPLGERVRTTTPAPPTPTMIRPDSLKDPHEDLKTTLALIGSNVATMLGTFMIFCLLLLCVRGWKRRRKIRKLTKDLTYENDHAYNLDKLIPMNDICTQTNKLSVIIPPERELDHIPNHIPKCVTFAPPDHCREDGGCTISNPSTENGEGEGESSTWL
ncbi:PREDICTED: leucine-rich repeat-containing protein 4B-like [Branchiostoma belcheri]|uniref:Leucine-rich repeat-containing protein 4B-like n=1 Tax=Branchiostoma belcheri TaxID=7741 RepID=A0A6P4Y023_BRABE|nr:PREDICTED: leucine-rich repeat-containing protein 4B-like [Branchiostoma belcheri]